MVQLRAAQTRAANAQLGSFNSNMVQLRVTEIQYKYGELGAFQFQYGTIKR